MLLYAISDFISIYGIFLFYLCMVSKFFLPLRMHCSIAILQISEYVAIFGQIFRRYFEILVIISNLACLMLDNAKGYWLLHEIAWSDASKFSHL